MDNDRYDPYVPRAGGSSGGGAPGGRPQGNDKIEALKVQVDEARGVMKNNIDEVLKRGDTLENLQDKTDNLAVSSQNFRRGANRVRKNMWWKDMKMRIIIGIAIAIILVIIIVPVVRAIQNK